MPREAGRSGSPRYRRCVDLLGYVAVVRRRWVPVVVIVLAGVLGGALLGLTGDKVYEATSRSVVVPGDNGTAQENFTEVQRAVTLLDTYRQVATSRRSAQQIADDLDLPLGAVQGALSARIVPGTFLIDVTARSGDPALAAMIADRAAQQMRTTVEALGSGAQTPVTADQVDAALIPSRPVEPRPLLSVAVGLLLGLVVAAVVVAVLEALDRSLTSPEQATQLLGAPLLGTVPRRRPEVPLPAASEDLAVSEPYRVLRTALLFLDPDAPATTLLVTSPVQGEGKTTTVANLAVALARGGVDVAVVDADLRRGKVGRVFGLEQAVGLSGVVTGQVTLDDALQEWEPGLLVLPRGAAPPNPTEIVGSVAMTRVLAELGRRVDVVLVDAPPVLPVADALVLSALTDGVVVVVRDGETVRPALTETRRRLEGVDARVAGLVYNGITRTSGGYAYSYRYAADDVESPPAPPSRAVAAGSRPASRQRKAVPAGRPGPRPAPAGAEGEPRPRREEPRGDATAPRSGARRRPGPEAPPAGAGSEPSATSPAAAAATAVRRPRPPRPASADGS